MQLLIGPSTTLPHTHTSILALLSDWHSGTLTTAVLCWTQGSCGQLVCQNTWQFSHNMCLDLLVINPGAMSRWKGLQRHAPLRVALWERTDLVYT